MDAAVVVHAFRILPRNVHGLLLVDNDAPDAESWQGCFPETVVLRNPAGWNTPRI